MPMNDLKDKVGLELHPFLWSRLRPYYPYLQPKCKFFASVGGIDLYQEWVFIAREIVATAPGSAVRIRILGLTRSRFYIEVRIIPPPWSGRIWI